MPQSRQRKTGKARKRNKSLYSAGKTTLPAGRNRQARIIAIVVVVVLAAGAIFYMVKNRGGAVGESHEITTASGLKYTDQVVGTGAVPQKGQMVSVHYTGTLENGEEFDSSRTKGRPMEYKFGVTPMIPGWDEGVSTMRVGGRRKLVVPSRLAYGQTGRPGIPPNATLLFDLELLDVK